MHTQTKPVNAIPRTANRLFITSLVLIGISTTFSVSDLDINFISAGIIPQAFMLGMLINHFVLWHLAKKEVAARSTFAEDPAKDAKAVSNSRTSSPTVISTTTIGAYPMCLISLPNIIWTCVAALVLLGFMWMPIFSGAMALRSKPNYGYRTSPNFPSSSSFLESSNYVARNILHGIFGYAECGVLFALFGIYVRERKSFLRSKVGITERNMETKV